MHVDQAGRPAPRWAGSHGHTRPTWCARSYRDEQGRPRKETLANLTGLPEESTAILEAAGFAGVAFTDVAEPVYYGPDVAAALDWVRGFTCTNELLKRLDPAAAACLPLTWSKPSTCLTQPSGKGRGPRINTIPTQPSPKSDPDPRPRAPAPQNDLSA
jgi:hypothetical protein